MSDLFDEIAGAEKAKERRAVGVTHGRDLFDDLSAVSSEAEEEPVQLGPADPSPPGVGGSAVIPSPPGLQEQAKAEISDIEKAFRKIPGAPELAELAAGANRSIAGVIDFFGPDTINAVLQVAGSDKRVPTVTETFTAPKGSFVEPGLKQEVLAGVGELAPVALGFGQLLRAAASRLPSVTAGESKAAGITRQLGASTPRQDIVGGALAGAGQEVGREVGGETGALVGGIAAPVAVAIPLSSAKSASQKLLKKSAPSLEKLQDTARGIYKSLDDSGVSVPSKSFDGLADDIFKTLKKEGSDADLTPKAEAVMRRFQAEKGRPKTLSDLDTLRKVSKNASGSIDKAEQRLGRIAIDKVDDFLDDIGGEVIDNKTAGAAFKSARDLWGRAKRTEILERAITDAKLQRSGFENGLRTQFTAIAKKINSGKLKGFTKEEEAAIRKVSQGTNAGNIAKFLGKFGVLDGATSRSLTSMGGIAIAGGATGSLTAVGAVPLVGQLSGALSQRMTLNNAEMAKAITRAGKNGLKISREYIKNTPKNLRKPSELAELMIKNKVNIGGINLRKVDPLTADAAVLAAVARFNDAKQKEE